MCHGIFERRLSKGPGTEVTKLTSLNEKSFCAIVSQTGMADAGFLLEGASFTIPQGAKSQIGFYSGHKDMSYPARSAGGHCWPQGLWEEDPPGLLFGNDDLVRGK